MAARGTVREGSVTDSSHRIQLPLPAGPGQGTQRLTRVRGTGTRPPAGAWQCSATTGTVRDNLENLEIMLDRPEQAATATFDQALPDSDEASSWSYCALIREEDWDPSLLTSLLCKNLIFLSLII